jgi:hypothetical protein
MGDLATPIMGTNPADWKWIQIAQVGTFKGHSAGDFELNPDVFNQIVRNFRDRGLPVAWDLEHASEQDPTSGSIPVTGAPAVGWIHDLDNRGQRGLWALVEWGPKAKDYIRNGEYRYCSPALRFNAKDPKTGQPIGVRLTSVAMTNAPFLDSMQPLAAKDNAGAAPARQEQQMTDKLTFAGGPKAILKALSDAAAGTTVYLTPDGNGGVGAVVQLGAGQAALAHKPSEYMPQVKMCFGLHQLATCEECSDHLDRLRDAVDQCGDAMGTHQGIDLSQFSAPLRDLVGADKGDTWEEVFDAVEALIEAAMAEHMVEEHGAGPQVAGSPTMTDKTTPTAQAAAQPAATPAVTEPTAASPAIATQEEHAMSDNAALKDLEVKAAELSCTLKDVQGKLSDAEKVVAAKDAEIATLKADAAKRAEEAAKARIDEAFDTYKDTKKLGDADKEAMAIILSSKPDTFEKLYPRVTADKRHLLGMVATGASTARQPRTDGALPAQAGAAGTKGPSLAEAARMLSEKTGMSLEDAQTQVLRAARKARAA